MATVVCGIERSEDARGVAQVAATLARRLASRLELVHVSAPGAAPAAHLIGTAMDSIRDDIASDDISVQLASGDPADRLLAAADNSSLVVLGSREVTAVRQVLFGSVTESVCRVSPVPVVIVPPSVAALEGHAVVLGVRDGRDEPCAHIAARLSAALGFALVLVHVYLPPVVAGHVSTAPDAVPLPVSQVDELAEHAERMVRELAAALSSELSAPTQLRVVSGPPGPGLERAADDEGAVSDRDHHVGGLTGAGPRGLRWGSRSADGRDRARW